MLVRGGQRSYAVGGTVHRHSHRAGRSPRPANTENKPAPSDPAVPLLFPRENLPQRGAQGGSATGINQPCIVGYSQRLETT